MLLKIFLASGHMIQTMMQWKALAAFGDTSPALAICHCLNFQQGLKRDDESPRQKLISPKDIAGETKNLFLSLWNYDIKNDYSFIFRKQSI